MADYLSEQGRVVVGQIQEDGALRPYAALNEIGRYVRRLAPGPQYIRATGAGLAMLLGFGAGAASAAASLPVSLSMMGSLAAGQTIALAAGPGAIMAGGTGAALNP